MISLKHHSITEIFNKYPEIYKSVFKEWTTEGNLPADIYVGYDNDEYGGFLSGYSISRDTWYMQRAGFIVGEQGKRKNYARGMQAMLLLHEKWKHILTLVKNTDAHVLRMAIGIGFKIIGVRQDTTGILWVELIHSREVVANG